MRNFIALAAGLLTTLPGCGRTDSKKATPAAPDAPPPPRLKADAWTGDGDDGPGTPPSLDFTGLRGVLAGRWERANQPGAGTKQSLMTRTWQLEFTGKGVEGKAHNAPNLSGRYVTAKDSLSITNDDQKTSVYGLEFLSDGEMALSPQNVDRGSLGGFTDLAGRWRRVSLPPGKPTAVRGTGPIADAQRQVQRIEQKLAKNESILKSALADRDEMAAKLRSVGVNSPADLTGNIRGQRLAENLVKLVSEIEGLERHIAVIDTELLKAKSLVRRLEQEEAGLTDVERQRLVLQLREAEERTNGTPVPTTPLDVEAAVEKALTGTPRPATPRNLK